MSDAELERLRKENAALKKGASSNVRMKVSEKGALSVYGMGRFPVTLYKEQWLKLLDMADDIHNEKPNRIESAIEGVCLQISGDRRAGNIWGVSRFNPNGKL